MRPLPLSQRSRQTGSVLFVAVILLLLGGLMTLFALNVGVFEQRSTGNDLRAKAVHEVAEAGLAQGFEYLMRQHPELLSDPTLWDKCGAAETVFPCGAIGTDAVDADGDPDTTATVTRRETVYRLKPNTANVIAGIDIALSKYMLPLGTSSKIASTLGGATVAYGVAPVVCFVKRPDKPDDPTKPPIPILCGNGTGATATTLRSATFVSVAKIPGESASTTLVQTIGQYPKLASLIGVPPLTTAGSAGVTGTLQVVTNPNAGGPGVPVSVWTRINVDKTGTTNTCYADEFFRYTPSNAVVPEPYQGTIRCDDCQCDANGAPTTLSFDNSGNSQVEGIDILDVDAGTNSGTGYQVGGHVGANYNVRADSVSYPVCEFPSDMFQFIFGTKVWNDSDADCFGETKLASVTYQNPESGASASVGRDAAYLYKHADKIINAANPTLLKAGQAGTDALLAVSTHPSTVSGMIWCQQIPGPPATDCDVPASAEIGSPDAPVILILDGPVQIHGTVYGLVFVRDTGTTLNPAYGSTCAVLNCNNYFMLQMNSGAAIYGAMVVQGQITANGNAAVIFDATVLGNLSDADNLSYATLPGAWNDQRSY